MGRGWGRKWGRDLPVGNAICFIRLFYKPDIQFVLEDLVTDYSVNSQIITITRERGGGEGERGGSGAAGIASIPGRTGPSGQNPPTAPAGVGGQASERGWPKGPRERFSSWSLPPLHLFKSSDSARPNRTAKSRERGLCYQ